MNNISSFYAVLNIYIILINNKLFFRGGDIIVAQSCWQWVNPNEYIYEKLPDGIHTLIIASSVLYDTNTKESFENLGKVKDKKINVSRKIFKKCQI